jgi:hypothetical protein
MIVLDTEKGESIDVLLWRLNDAIIWCSKAQPTNHPSQVLRSKTLTPQTGVGLKERLNWIADQRRKSLSETKAVPAISLLGGRLLWYAPDRNTSDGVSQYESSGFIEADNSPPWDTWVAYLYEYDEKSDRQNVFGYIAYLVSWIPPAYLELADKGIRANVDVCIGWLDEMDDSAAVQMLRDRGIL